MGTMRRRAWRSAQNERQRVRCADAPTRQQGRRRIQFARALASQRPPSCERPSLGGGGAGRALFPSLCPSPRSRSIDDAEHRRRPVRGPPACSSAGTPLRARRRRRPRQHTYKESQCRRSWRPVDDPAPSARKGHGGVPGPRGCRRGPFGGAASVEDGRAALRHAATRMHGPRRGPSTTPQETVFKRHELNSCVGRAKS